MTWLMNISDVFELANKRVIIAGVASCPRPIKAGDIIEIRIRDGDRYETEILGVDLSKPNKPASLTLGLLISGELPVHLRTLGASSLVAGLSYYVVSI